MTEFQRIVAEVLRRFSEQTSHPVSAAEVSRFALQLAAVVEERGLPPPLGAGEIGAPGKLPADELDPLLARVVEGLSDEFFHDAAKQFAKACFYPEFKICRDSFREVSRAGACRRQEVERARDRLSGSHCVDCPHWVALTAETHAEYLRAEWRNDPAELAKHQEIFLPEDFRRLRHWLHAAAREMQSRRRS